MRKLEELIALQRFPYAGKMIRKAERFTPQTEGDRRILIAMRKATTPSAADAAAATARRAADVLEDERDAAPPAIDKPARKRAYRRRDLVAESAQ
jgi:hypothetical protein